MEKETYFIILNEIYLYLYCITLILVNISVLQWFGKGATCGRSAFWIRYGRGFSAWKIRFPAVKKVGSRITRKSSVPRWDVIIKIGVKENRKN
jgi:hypothetical protein